MVRHDQQSWRSGNAYVWIVTYIYVGGVTDGQKEKKITDDFPRRDCIMKFSYHAIFLFLLKVQRILNKSSSIMFIMFV